MDLVDYMDYVDDMDYMEDEGTPGYCLSEPFNF
jgi:hypothetical protein